MATTLIKDSVGSITVQLVDTAGLPVLLLTFADVTADLRKAGGAFAAMTLTALNFIEIGLGTYQVNLAVGDTDTLGNLDLRISGATIQTYLITSFVAESVPTTPTTTPDLPTTAIFGFVRGPDNVPKANASVSYRILSLPSIVNPNGDAVLLSAELVTVLTDSEGFWTLPIISGAVVDFFIPASSYRRTITVPAATTSLFQIP